MVDECHDERAPQSDEAVFCDRQAGAMKLRIEVLDSVSAIAREGWNAMIPPGTAGSPFLRAEFLAALEDSGCVGGKTGWTTRFLIARAEDSRVVGAMPLYEKTHSMGEYVFDHSWANALMRAGLPYYPKMQGAVPFTPVPGPRVLSADLPKADRESVRELLVRGAVAFTESVGASSLHVTFHTDEERGLFERAGLALRTGVQFHFANNGYKSFDDFLATLSSSRRKNLRKERERAVEGRTVTRLLGAEITHEDWDFFFRCYMDTGSRKWGTPYLNREFFRLLSERMPESCVLFIASENGARIASALNLVDDTALYGRYWGCIADVPFLHFELCYYQAIDFAVERGLTRVEAGAQGEHKLARGYVPVPTYSSHWLCHPGLRAAVEQHLEVETRAIHEEMEQLREVTPFRKDK